MMLAIFLTLLLALVLARIGQRPVALAVLALCFGLSVYLFLWEIWSPETGFRMPWIDTWLHRTPDLGAGARG
jgi:hypothetical protein